MTKNAYENGSFGKTETERLQLQDELLAPISLDAIGEISTDTIVLDIGAGGSIALAEKIKEFGATYIGLDISAESIAVMKDNKIPAIQASATDLPIGDKCIDIVHSRATSAWLPVTARIKMYEEMLRVGKEVVIMNFDWTNCSATGENGAFIISGLEHVLTSTGFDPNYGGKQHDEIQKLVSGSSLCNISTTVLEDYASPEKSASYIRLTVSAIIEQMYRLGGQYTTMADLLSVALENINNELATAEFTLPSIYITKISKN